MGGSETPVIARPLDPRDPKLPETVRDILEKGKRSWLKNTEVCDMLLNHNEFNLRVAKEPPRQPPGGSLFLFDRKAVRFFRKDNHRWRKKADGKTVRETHEKLKVGNLDMLNCYYSHADSQNGLQRRCYWLLESKDDIVLVHYLNIAQRQAEKRMLTEDSIPLCNDGSESNSQSDPANPSDLSRSSDCKPALRCSLSSPAAQAGLAGASGTAVADACPVVSASSGADNLVQLIPSVSSMDMLYSVTDRMPSLGDTLHSNAAVQELLHSWKNETLTMDLPVLQQAHDSWQQMDNLGAASSRVQKPLQLQSHLTAASNDVDYKESAMSPNPFLEAARQSSQTEHRAQIHQPAVSNQCLGEVASLPMSSSAVDNLTGALLLGSSTQPHHQLQPQLVGGEAPLQRLGIRQLQELLGMNTLGKHLNQSRQHQLHDGQCTTTIATSSTTSSASRLLPQKRPHASISSLLQSSVPAAAFAGVSTTPASGQLPVHHSLADSQTALWPQPEALGAFRSQRASLTGMLRTHTLSACGPSQDCSRSLLQQQTAFLRPFQTALHGPKDAAARQTSSQTLRASPFMQASEPAQGCPLTLHLPRGLGWQGSSLASTEVDSSSKLSSSTSSKGLLMGVCQSQAASPALPQDALHTSVRPHEHLSQRSPCMSGSFRPDRWRNLPSHVAALPSSDAPSDTVPGSSRLCLQGQGLQCQPSFANSTAGNVRGELQWFKDPEAMRQAALMLNAQLAHIDKQVLEHVVPHCGQQGKRGPVLPDASFFQRQVEYCENQLRQLELNSQQLLQVSAEQDSKVSKIGRMLSHQDSSRDQDQAGSRRLPDEQPPTRQLSDRGSTTYPLFDMLECGPVWDYTAGGAMLLVVASSLNAKLLKETCGQVQVMFDKTQVSATVLWPGVMQCIAPAHEAGNVKLCLTLGDAQPCSKVISFGYKQTPASIQPQGDRQPTAELSDRHLQLQLLHVLLQEQTSVGGSSQEDASLFVSAMQRPSCLAPFPSGLPDTDMPAMSMNRDQLLQQLFRLELDCQAPQGTPRHGKSMPEKAYYVRGPLSHPTALNALSTHGVAMLHLVAGLGYDWACMSLIRRGADSNLPDSWGLTALHWAASRGREACVAALLAKGSDPTCTSQACTGTAGKTAADMASSAGYLGIAAFLSEASLVQALCKAQTGKTPAPLDSLQDWHASQQQPAVAVSIEVSPQRKRCRQDDGLDDQAVPPLSAVESSARDPRAPNVNVVMRAPTQVEHAVAAVAVTHNGDDRVSEVLSNNLASQSRSAAPATTGLDGLAAPCGGSKVGAVLSAAKQAAAVLMQHAYRREQHLANAAAEHAQQMHRDEVALHRLNDSTKMWGTLKKIAQAELAPSSNQATDSVTLRFLSLAPRVARLNKAVHDGLVASGCAEADAEGAGMTDGSTSHARRRVFGIHCTQQHLLKCRAVKLAKNKEGASTDHVGHEKAVQHIKAMTASPEGTAQYERLVEAVKGSKSRTSVFQSMPAVQK